MTIRNQQSYSPRQKGGAVGLISGDLFPTIHPYMAIPQEIEPKVSTDTKSKEGKITGLIFSKIDNFLLAKEVVSKLFAYEMKEGIETLLIDCHKDTPASMEKFDQVLILNPLIGSGDEWKSQFKNIVENNLNLGGNLLIVHTELNQDPKCMEIEANVIKTLLEKPKVTREEEIGKLEMDNVRVEGVTNFVFVLRAKNCKVPNPPEIPTAKVK
jgi:hypothetical protein